jgi:hypothetical protein
VLLPCDAAASKVTFPSPILTLFEREESFGRVSMVDVSQPLCQGTAGPPRVASLPHAGCTQGGAARILVSLAGRSCLVPAAHMSGVYGLGRSLGLGFEVSHVIRAWLIARGGSCRAPCRVDSRIARAPLLLDPGSL